MSNQALRTNSSAVNLHFCQKMNSIKTHALRIWWQYPNIVTGGIMKKTLLLLTSILLAAISAGTLLAIDSLNVNLIGRLNLCWDTTSDIALQDGLVYLAAGYSGVRILDVTQPEQPIEIGWCDSWGGATSVAVADDYAYVTCYWGGFRTYDVSDPAYPVETDVQELEYMISDVILQDGYAWVAGRWDGLYIFDLTDPAHPQLTGACQTPGSDTFDLAVSDTLAFLVDGYQGLRVVNVADVTAPVEIASLEIPATTWGVAVQDDWLFVASDNLHTVSIADPYNPFLYGSPWSPDCYASGVEVYNDHVWVTSNGGLFVANTTNPGSLVEVCSLEDSYANGIAFEDDLACLSAGNRSGLRTLDITDPGDVFELGSLARPLQAERIAVAGELAVFALYDYMQPGSDGVQLLDISDPAQPQRAGILDLQANVAEVALAGQYAMAACWGQGLKIIDISDIAAPFQAAVCDTTGNFSDLALNETHAFVTLPYEGLRAIDISDPLEPETCGILGIADGTHAVAIEDTLACILGQGFQVVNIADPEQMEMLGSTNDLPGYPVCVAASSTLACLVFEFDGSGGVVVVDFSDPDNPEPRGWCYTPGGDCASDIVIRDHYACVADQAGDVQIIDFADPDNLIIVGSYPMPDRTRAVAWHEEGLIYAVDGNDLEVLDFTLMEEVQPRHTAPPQFSLLTAWPNPFNNQITFEANLTEPGYVSLEIFDLLGRQVDLLDAGSQRAGKCHLTWQGAGSSGIYFARLMINNRQSDLIKVVQVK